MTHFEQRMAEFRTRFLLRASEDARGIADALAASDFAALRSICHGLAGNAGMFGFTEVGILARTVEDAVDSRAGEAVIRELAANLLALLADLERKA